MQGFFFDSRYCMRQTLGALIQCAIWHKEWTNVLYDDRLKLLAFLLDWHARAPKFSGEQLYSLLFAAHYHAWLRPITRSTAETLQAYNPLFSTLHGTKNDVGRFLSETAARVLSRLSSDEKALYSHLEEKFKTYLQSEYHMYYKAVK
jgi:hypothetical protein